MGPLKAWTLASRFRYALVWGGINALVIIGLYAVFGSISIRRLLPLAILVVLMSFLAQGWIWYPREKRRLTARHG